MAETSAAIQDYLKVLFKLTREQPETNGDSAELVSTTEVADRLGVSAPSVTNMLKKLEGMGLVAYVPYRGVELTAAGLKMALEVIRHHRLIETYLAEALGVPWDRVHAEAEVLEHVLSEDLEDRMATVLGDPAFDPHGHPIPGKDGTMPAGADRRLWDLSPGQSASVEHVSDSEADVLRYLADIGIRPGVSVEVVERGPLAGPLFVRVREGAASGEEDTTHALSKELAQTVWVSRS